MRGLIRLLLRLPPLAVVAVCIVLLGVTGNKLWRMAQVRGWVAGAETAACLVTGKAEDGRRVRLETPRGAVDGHVTPELWARLEVGTKVEARFLPGDRTPYFPDGPYAANGQFAFDGALFALWLLGVLFYGRRHVLQRAMRRVRHG